MVIPLVSTTPTALATAALERSSGESSTGESQKQRCIAEASLKRLGRTEYLESALQGRNESQQIDSK